MKPKTTKARKRDRFPARLPRPELDSALKPLYSGSRPLLPCEAARDVRQVVTQCRALRMMRSGESIHDQRNALRKFLRQLVAAQENSRNPLYVNLLEAIGYEDGMPNSFLEARPSLNIMIGLVTRAIGARPNNREADWIERRLVDGLGCILRDHGQEPGTTATGKLGRCLAIIIPLTDDRIDAATIDDKVESALRMAATRKRKGLQGKKVR